LPGSPIEVATGRISLDGSTVTVLRTDRALIKLRCTGTARCSGRLTLTIRITTRTAKGKRTRSDAIGAASYSIRAGTSAIVRVRINRLGRTHLTRGHGHLRARLTISKTSPSPRTTTVEAVHLTLQRPRRR
jgi:hypothetical protein